MSHDKNEAIRTINEMMQSHNITLAELKQSVDQTPAASTKSDIAMRLFSILGGIFILSGIGVYVGMFWDEMNSAMRIIITLGVGLVAQALSLQALAGVRYARAIKPLLLIAVFLQTTGWFVAIYELMPRGDDERYAVLFVMALMGIQQYAIFVKYRLTLLLFGVIAFAYTFLFVLLDLMDIDWKWSTIVLGLSMTAVAHALRTTSHARLCGLGYFIGSMLFYIGLFDLLRGSMIEVVYLAAVCGGIYISTVARSTALLAVSTFAMLSYIGYFTAEHFVNSVGWPLSLVVMGIAFFAVSGFSLRMKKHYIS